MSPILTVSGPQASPQLANTIAPYPYAPTVTTIMPGGGTPPAGAGDVQRQFEDILALVLARSRGEAEDADVERALSAVVPTAASPGGAADVDAAAATPPAARRPAGGGIVPDVGEYDDGDGGGVDRDVAAGGPSRGIAAAKGRATARKPARDTQHDPARAKLLDEIPLGKMVSS